MLKRNPGSWALVVAALAAALALLIVLCGITVFCVLEVLPAALSNILAPTSLPGPAGQPFLMLEPTPTSTPLPTTPSVLALELREWMQPRGIECTMIVFLAVVLFSSLWFVANRRTGKRKENRPLQQDDLVGLRSLLLAAFTPQELILFCLDHALFRPVLDELGSDPSLNKIVDRLITYCAKRGLCVQLLAEIKVINEYQYNRFKPDLPQSWTKDI